VKFNLHSNLELGKGDRPRPIKDKQRFNRNFDEIFRKQPSKEKRDKPSKEKS
tara:strand:- start:586 stop:741 length:156 start_codon:yes stop_codon:yes gene_type:complete